MDRTDDEKISEDGRLDRTWMRVSNANNRIKETLILKVKLPPPKTFSNTPWLVLVNRVRSRQLGPMNIREAIRGIMLGSPIFIRVPGRSCFFVMIIVRTIGAGITRAKRLGKVVIGQSDNGLFFFLGCFFFDLEGGCDDLLRIIRSEWFRQGFTCLT